MTQLTIISSELTDTRLLEKRLAGAGIPFRVERMGMADAKNRARYAAMKRESGWKYLPLVLVDGRPLGGEPEVIDWLDRNHHGADSISKAARQRLPWFVAGVVLGAAAMGAVLYLLASVSA